MKKKKRGLNKLRKFNIQIHLTNRWLYTFIALGILAIIGVTVYAVTYPASGAGHPYTEISTCGANKILKMNADGTAWTCGDDVGGITSESDPTVLASVKDGVSWSEVSSKPFEIAVMDIGDWNMDEDSLKSVILPFETKRVIYAMAWIKADSNYQPPNSRGPLMGPIIKFGGGGTNCETDGGISTTLFDKYKIMLTREDGCYFDSTVFDQTNYNRGFLIVYYI